MTDNKAKCFLVTFVPELIKYLAFDTERWIITALRNSGASYERTGPLTYKLTYPIRRRHTTVFREFRHCVKVETATRHHRKMANYDEWKKEDDECKRRYAAWIEKGDAEKIEERECRDHLRKLLDNYVKTLNPLN